MKTILALILLAFTINLFSQEPSFSAKDKVSMIENAITLSKLQKIQAFLIFENYKSQLDSLSNTTFERNREKCKAEMLLLLKAKKRVYAILTPEQYQLYKAYRVNRRDSFIQSRSTK